MTNYRQTQDDLRQKLREQLGFLRASAAGFDAGATSEAARLAVTVRVLVHDTRTSHSLLALLGVKSSLEFFDTGTDIPPTKQHRQIGPNTFQTTAILAFPLSPLNFRQDETGSSVGFRPRFHREVAGTPKPFADWWQQEITGEVPIGRRLTRRDVVLAYANKEGGAHVDPELPADWALIMRGDPISAKINGRDMDIPSPMPPTMRQIAHEVDATLVAAGLDS